MRRRDFIVLSTSVTLPLLRSYAARAQEAKPVIGFLSAASPGDGYARPLSALLKGLGETGFVEGRDVTIEYRWADGHYDRLPSLVADLVAQRVSLIVATSTPAALAAKAVTTKIPIVFETAADPVHVGLVPSLNRPGGNVTGVTQMSVGIVAKELEVLHEITPTARLVALMVNQTAPALADPESQEMHAAARTLGLEVCIVHASSEHEFEAAFADTTQAGAGALVIGADSLFTNHASRLAALSVQHRVPTVYKGREFALAGGLLSYGLDITKTFYLAGTYTGRILKGEKPAELPVQQPTEIEMFLNLKTAKALGVTVPLPLLGRADEVFE
jgi:putative ABC transport system substrate-binding protein